MAITQFSTMSPSTIKLWSQRTMQDFVSDTELISLMLNYGVIRRQDEANRNYGDRIRISFLNRLQEKGLLGDQMATGQEKALTYFTDDVELGRTRLAVNIPADQTLSRQRVNYDLPEDTYYVMSEWLKERMVLSLLNQGAGNNANAFIYDGVTYTGAERLEIWGQNSVLSPSATRIFRPNGLATDQAVAGDATATFKGSYILELEAAAERNRPLMRPIINKEGIRYVLVLHTDQWTDFINDTTSPVQYRDIMGNMIAGGSQKDGRMMQTAMYSQTLVLKTDKIPQGVNSISGDAVANTRRAVFCGADAFGLGFGMGFDNESPAFRIAQDFLDVGDINRYAISVIYGLKKVRFDAIDHAVQVYTTYTEN